MKLASKLILTAVAFASVPAFSWDHRWENHWRRHHHGEHFECVAHPRGARDDVFFGYGEERFRAEQRALEECRNSAHRECRLEDCIEHGHH